MHGDSYHEVGYEPDCGFVEFSISVKFCEICTGLKNGPTISVNGLGLGRAFGSRTGLRPGLGQGKFKRAGLRAG